MVSTVDCQDEKLEDISYKNENEDMTGQQQRKRRHRKKSQRIRIVQVTNTDDDQSVERKSNELEVIYENKFLTNPQKRELTND